MVGPFEDPSLDICFSLGWRRQRYCSGEHKKRASQEILGFTYSCYLTRTLAFKNQVIFMAAINIGLRSQTAETLIKTHPPHAADPNLAALHAVKNQTRRSGAFAKTSLWLL
jgi:hypothetical protein